MTSTRTETRDRIRVGSDEIAFRVTGAETGGALVVADVHMPAGGGPPAMHRHPSAEVYRVGRGELAVYLEDDRGEVERLVLTQGDVVHIPGGRSHTVRNESAGEAEAYAVFTPGEEMEGFVRAAASLSVGGPPSPQDVLALAQRYGIEFTRPVPAGG